MINRVNGRGPTRFQLWRTHLKSLINHSISSALLFLRRRRPAIPRNIALLLFDFPRLQSRFVLLTRRIRSLFLFLRCLFWFLLCVLFGRVLISSRDEILRALEFDGNVAFPLMKMHSMIVLPWAFLDGDWFCCKEEERWNFEERRWGQNSGVDDYNRGLSRALQI